MDLLMLLSTSESDSSDSSANEDELSFADVVKYINLKNDINANNANSKEKSVEFVVDGYTESEFINEFRIRTDVYEQLVMHFEESDFYRNLFSTPGGRQPLSAGKHILIFLYFVGSEAAKYRKINNMFGVSLSTLHDIIKRVAEFMCSLGPQVIKWPDQAEIKDIKAYFKNNTQIPDAVGIMDTTSIVIDKPPNDPDAYVNRDGNFSIQLQGIVDHNKRFTDIFIGYPGSVHDRRIFKNSSIYDNLSQLCDGGYILADSAYPIMKNVLIPYKNDGFINEQQKHFNTLHSKALTHVRHTFWLLRQRFRQLHHLKLRKPKFIVQVIKACCILHNMTSVEELEILHETMQILWATENNPTSYYDDDEDREENTDDAENIRNNLTSRLWNNRK